MARRTPPAAPPRRSGGGGRRRFLPGRPKLRRVLLLSGLLLPLLLLVAAVGGYLYAKSVFDKVERIPLEEVLSTDGTGTNYLVVGSDSREVEELEAAGLDPAGFQDGGGERSDTMLVLRFADGEASMLSIPRDLQVEIAETGSTQKINAAYNGGPPRLIRTIQQNLGIPIHHYLEVDFVSFASLVDSLGGITIDFPYPVIDTSSGLDVKTAGPTVLDGPQSLAYVRSRHYTEIRDGKRVVEPTGDLGRVIRQQLFLTTVLGKLGESKNPLTLARAADAASGGLRIDDTLGFTEAVRLGWRLRGMDPTSVVLPTENGGRTSAGAVLVLVQPQADQVLAGFR